MKPNEINGLPFKVDGLLVERITRFEPAASRDLLEIFQCHG
jgi:hypothetical protein